MLLCGGWGRESESRAPSQRSLGPPPEPVAAITERRGGNPTRARRAPESSRRSGRGQSWEEASTGSRRLRRSPSSRAVPRCARPARVVARRTRPRALHDGRGVGQTPLYLRGARPQRRGCPYGWPHVLWRVCRRGEASDRIADEAPSRDRAAHQHRPSAVTGSAGHVPPPPLSKGSYVRRPHSYTIRVATDEDAEALRRLAALDSKAPLEATVLVGEIAGTPAAAISLGDDRAIADLTSTFSSSRKGAAKWPAPRAACPPTASVASALPETAFAKSSAPADPGRVCSREHARSRKPPGRSGSSGWSRLAAARGAARPTASGHADEQRRARQMMDFQSHIMRLTRPLI
jgi:hypothetical protein